MTPQEQQMLDNLIERVRNTNLPSKDGDADRRIQDALGRDPNALYILCQTVLVQGYALEQAQKQLADAKQRQQNTSPRQPSFLEKIFGRSDDDKDDGSGGQPQYNQPQYGQPGYSRPGYNTPSNPAQQYGEPAGGYRPGYGQPGYGQATYAPPAPYPPQTSGYAPQPGYAPQGAFGGGGFLQGALQTAAGVAMGELAFQSISGLFRGFGHAAGYDSDRAVGFGDLGSNNDTQTFGDSGGFFSREQAENGTSDQLSPDIEDRRGDSNSFFGNSDSNSGNGFFGNEDSATDSGYDTDNSLNEQDGSDFTDSSSFDDGSDSFDDSGSFSDDN